MVIMTTDITNYIDQALDIFYPVRFVNSFKSIRKEKGYLAATTVATAFVFQSALSIGPAYFCGEGAVRSFIEMANTALPIYTRLRNAGNAGGWSQLDIFALLGFCKITDWIVQEGEYLKLESLSNEWLEATHSAENPANAENTYVELNDLLDVSGSRCFFPKSIMERHLTALKICANLKCLDNDSELSYDRQLEPIFQRIHSKVEKKLAFTQHLYRAYQGLTVETFSQISRLFFGALLPLCLVNNALLSIVGTVGLADDVLVNRTGLEEIGHFGEWIINAEECLTGALILHRQFILKNGDFKIMQKIYQKEINALKNNKDLHNRLCVLANQEFTEMVTLCYNIRWKRNYQFELL